MLRWVVNQWPGALHYEFPVSGGHTVETTRKMEKKKKNSNDKNKLRRP